MQNDRRVEIRAIREGWAIPAARRPEIIANLVKMAAGEVPEASHREAVMAARALLGFSRLELDALLAESGLDHAALAARVAALEESRRARVAEGVGTPGAAGGGPGSGPAAA